MEEHLTPLDATFLELEEGDESAHMHVGWAMIFAPLPEGGTPSLAQVRELLDERLEALPRFRRRLSSPRTGRFSWPSWQEDRDFDVANHVRHATLPAPGGEAELLEWLGDFYSHRLDRAHPLWESVLLDGFADGGWALATKVHHSLVDGMSGNSVTMVILDAEPHPAPGSKGLLAALMAEGDGGEGAEREHGPLGALAGVARAGVDAALHPRKELGALLSRSREIAGLLRDELGYEGVILTDDLEMRALAATYTVPDAAVEAIAAGCDGVLVCRHLVQDRAHDIDAQVQVLEALIHAVEDERIPYGRIEDALARQRRAKERFLAAPTLAAHSVTTGHSGRNPSTGSGLPRASSRGKGQPYREVVGCDAHRQVAEEMARYL